MGLQSEEAYEEGSLWKGRPVQGIPRCAGVQSDGGSAGMRCQPDRTGSGRAPRGRISPRCDSPASDPKAKSLASESAASRRYYTTPSPCSLSSSHHYNTIPLQALARRSPKSQDSSTHILLPSSTTFYLFRSFVPCLSFGHDLATTRLVTQTCTITCLNSGPTTRLPYDELMCSLCLVISFSITLRLLYDDLQSANSINCTGSGLRIIIPKIVLETVRSHSRSRSTSRL